MIIDAHEHVMTPVSLQLQKLQTAGIDRAILFGTTPHPERAQNFSELKEEMKVLFKILSGGVSKEANMARYERNNLELAALVRDHPDKFYAFGSVPTGLTPEENGLWIEKLAQSGFKGVGEFTLSDEQICELEPIFQALCDFSGLCVWVHTFFPLGRSGLEILMNLTKKYPKISVIFGHMGGYHWMDVIDFASVTKNTYIDLSAAFSTLALKMAISQLPEKCIFSSDAPYSEPLLCKDAVSFVSGNEQVREMVLGGNILRLIGG
ncbi:amidohydrolase family protein [Campylobacter curvus]|uniref:amidohydrolase family protein n=1 Tax=Campylobacter curvus TaxID=200 RepID=UPI00146FE418|nr:amidohydrolase family protein [Campylobacter curvus]